MSAEYIAAAKANFGARGTFHCRLLEHAAVATLEPFDLVMGIGVLHHLDDDTGRQFMTLAKAALKRGGTVLTLDACYAPKQNPIARFIISKDRGQHVRNEAGYRALAERIFPAITGAVRHWGSPATRTGPWNAAHEVPRSLFANNCKHCMASR